MGKVTVAIGGRGYPLSCADGEEAHLAALGEHLSRKADELTTAIGSMSEPRLLLMAGLQVADELFALRARGEVGDVGATSAEAVSTDVLAALLARVEALAVTLEE